MNKLEEKLSASVKPGQMVAASKPAAKSTSARKSKVVSGTPMPSHLPSGAADLNAGTPVLHPTRIWPD